MKEYLLQFSGESYEDWKREKEVIRNRRSTYKTFLQLRGYSKERIEKMLDERYPL